MKIAAEALIGETIRLAMESIRQGGGPFGALVVKDDVVISTGHNTVSIDNDPTAHAEVNAIRSAAKKLDTFDLSGCVIYTSCEPCPMCLGAIYWSRIKHIYFAAGREAAANAGFDDSFIYRQIDILPQHRSVPAWQVTSPDALLPFDTWKSEVGKINY
ncbi:MAG: nucleoside deaminase [Bacteroidia bacterium]|nr:nucleoside deaminase [Bacteroidia bacterium]